MLSIIIVNYRSAHHLLNCLRSLREQDHIDQYEIQVVDNDGEDQAKALCGAEFPGIHWIETGENLGFARANNIGIRASTGDTCLLLNPDTIIEDQAVANTYQSLLASDWSACGLQLLNPDRSPQISGNYTMTGGLNHLLPLPYTGWILKLAGQAFSVKKTNIPEASDAREVDWINGAFLMVKREAIRKAGLLDEDFFLYFEEAEWGYRLKKVGKLGIFGQYRVIHLQGEAANDAFNSTGKGYYNLYDRKGLQIMLSCLLRIRKQFGLGWFFFHLAVYWLTIPIFLVAGFFHAILGFKDPLKTLSRVYQFARNLVCLLPWVPGIVFRKPRLYKVL